MKMLASLSSALLISVSSYAQDTHLDTTGEIVKNVGTALRECPISYGAKVLVVVGETIPVLSAFTKIGHDLNESSKQIEALQQKREVADNTYVGNGRKFSSYFWGGVVASVYERLKQVGTGQLNSDEVQKAFADGYFVTRSETTGTRACSEAVSKTEQLIEHRIQN